MIDPDRGDETTDLGGSSGQDNDVDDAGDEIAQLKAEVREQEGVVTDDTYTGSTADVDTLAAGNSPETRCPGGDVDEEAGGEPDPERRNDDKCIFATGTALGVKYG
jgi:hypothetical protein